MHVTPEPRPNLPSQAGKVAIISMAKVLRTAMAAVEYGTVLIERRQSQIKTLRRMPGASTTCTAMCGNGPKIVGTTTTSGHRLTVSPGVRGPAAIVSAVFCVAAPGVPTPKTPAVPTAIVSTECTGGMTLASEWCVRPYLRALVPDAPRERRSPTRSAVSNFFRAGPPYCGVVGLATGNAATYARLAGGTAGGAVRLVFPWVARRVLEQQSGQRLLCRCRAPPQEGVALEGQGAASRAGNRRLVPGCHAR